MNRNKPQNSSENKTKISNTQKAEGSKPHEKEGTHEEVQQEEKIEDIGQGSENIAKMGPYKPKSNIKLQVILNDPALLEHRDHMTTYAIICKFMGI